MMSCSSRARRRRSSATSRSAELGCFDDQLVRLPWEQLLAATYVGATRRPASHGPAVSVSTQSTSWALGSWTSRLDVDRAIDHDEAGDTRRRVGVPSEREAAREDQCQRDNESSSSSSPASPAPPAPGRPRRTHHRPPATAAEQDAGGHGRPHGHDGAVHVGQQQPRPRPPARAPAGSRTSVRVRPSGQLHGLTL